MSRSDVAPSPRRPLAAASPGRPGRLLLGLIAGSALLAACSGSASKPGPSPTADFRAVAPVPVPLAVAATLKSPVKVGLVVTSGSQRGEGGDDIGLAAGALVAQYRLGLASAGKVSLDVVDDHGNGAGSAAAMSQLATDGVVGVVYASEGDHMRQGLAIAAAHGLPVLLPYAGSAPSTAASDGSKPALWFTGPTSAQEVAAISAALSSRSLTDAYVLESGSGVPDVSGLAPVPQVVSLRADPTLPAQVTAVAKRIAADTNVNAVVVIAPAATEAEVVADLQQQAVQLPVVLGQQALTPTFASRLLMFESTGEASSSGAFSSVGVASRDSDSSPNVAAFFAGLRLAAQTPAVLGLVSTQTFAANGSATADTRSHDAVLALVTAAARATTPDAAGTLAALRTLKLTSADGLAGPDLTFSTSTTLADASVRELQSSTQNPGQRSGSSQSPTGLWWFALPSTS